MEQSEEVIGEKQATAGGRKPRVRLPDRNAAQRLNDTWMRLVGVPLLALVGRRVLFQLAWFVVFSSLVRIAQTAVY